MKNLFILLILSLNSPISAATLNQNSRSQMIEVLKEHGVDDYEAQLRVKNLSDEEVNKYLAEVETIGQDSTITIGVSTVLLICLILLIL